MTTFKCLNCNIFIEGAGNAVRHRINMKHKVVQTL
jgi:hypothetical protein